MSSTGSTRVGISDPNGTPVPIIAEMHAAFFTVPTKRITLTKDFAQECPDGWPSPPSETGVMPVMWYPHTIPSGTIMVQWGGVADALIAANAATLA